MRIGIDATSLLYGTGVSFYTSNLLKALSEIDKKNEFIVFGSSLRGRGRALLEKKIKALELGRNFFVKIVSLPPSFLEILWHKGRFFPIERLIGPIDVFHAWDWLLPKVEKAKVITTIHDLAVLKFPQLFHPKIVKVQKKRLKLVKNYADTVVVVSENTKNDCIELLQIPKEKIHVIYEAVPKERKVELKTEEIKKVVKRLNLPKNYLLTVATREPRKNLKGCIEASQKIGLPLVVVGKFGWGEDVKKTPNVFITGYLKDRELAAVYKAASCFLYPSYYEGFGLPVLEAMFYHLPVVTSKNSSLEEITGGAAVLIDPKNISSIAEGIKEALEKRDILITKGQKRVKQFSWEKTAKETLKLYKALMMTDG